MARSYRSPGLRLGGSALTLLVIALLAATPAAGHFSPRKAIWGPSTHGTTSLWPTYHRLGVGIYESALDWSVIAPRRPKHPRDPNDPAYHWPAVLRHDIVEASRYHIRVALMLTFAPAWANGRRPERWAPQHPSDYANFAAAAARRYPSVHLWMIWGEPSRQANFQPLANAPGARLTPAQARGPHLYARLLDSAYFALKAVSQRNLVIGGMTFAAGDIRAKTWVKNLVLPDGRPPHLDLYGHNPFSAREPNLGNPPSPYKLVDFSDLGRLSGWVRRYLGRGRRIPLFISEFTIPTAPDHEFPFWVDPPVQARWINAAFSIVHHWSGIYALGWIHLYDEPGITNGGLLTSDGQPKPGFFAFEHG